MVVLPNEKLSCRNPCRIFRRGLRSTVVTGYRLIKVFRHENSLLSFPALHVRGCMETSSIFAAQVIYQAFVAQGHFQEGLYRQSLNSIQSIQAQSRQALGCGASCLAICSLELFIALRISLVVALVFIPGISKGDFVVFFKIIAIK